MSGRPPSGRIKIQLDPNFVEFQSSQLNRERLLNVTNTKALPKPEADHQDTLDKSNVILRASMQKPRQIVVA